MRLRQSRRFDRSRSVTFEANSLTNVSKLLLLALVAGLFAGCAATRPISDVALGAGGAYLGHEISNGDPLLSRWRGGRSRRQRSTSLRREETIREGVRHRLRKRQERRREAVVLALRLHAEAAQPGRQRATLSCAAPRTAD